MTTRAVRSVDMDVLRDYMQRLLVAGGCDPENANIAADVFLEADMRGIGLQGLDHMPTMIRNLKTGRIRANGRPRVTRETSATALVDGDNAPGQVAGVFAADLSVRKARESGACVVGVTNSADLFMIGYYAGRMAQAGMVAMVMTDAPPLVRPHGGVERVLGTNPLSVAIPTSGSHPLLLDLSTSALSASRVRQAAYYDEDVPEADGVDREGNPATKAADVCDGAIGPLAGHKGFGLGLCIALLAGPLTGSLTGKALSAWHSESTDTQVRKGHLFVAIDPVSFGDPDSFRKSASAYLHEVKDSKKLSGVDEIRIPGERTFSERSHTLASGRVKIYEAVWTKMSGLAAELGVTVPK